MQPAFVVVPLPRSCLLQLGPSTAAGAGDVLVVTMSLFDAPTTCVGTDADVPAIVEGFAVNASRHDPGWVVEVIVNDRLPATAVACALPEVALAPLPPALVAVMLQTFAEVESRVAVTTVEPSLMLVLPAESWTFTVTVDFEMPSAAIGVGLKLAESLAE